MTKTRFSDNQLIIIEMFKNDDKGPMMRAAGICHHHFGGYINLADQLLESLTSFLHK